MIDRTALAMGVCVLLTGITCGQDATPKSPKSTRKPGALVIVGGGGTPKSVLKRTLDMAGGGTARVVIVPHASQAESRGQSIEEAFRNLGAINTHILKLDNTTEARREIAAADLIWFPGGQQSRLIRALDDAKVADAIRQRRAAGAIVGGTSAGAAVMSDVMIPTSPESPALRRGNTPIMKGLGLAPRLIIDQHFVERKRMNRLLSAVLDHPSHIGVGISESTAIVVQGSRFTVAGEGSVVIIDARHATISEDGPKEKTLHSARSLALQVLRANDTYDWNTTK